MVEECACGFEAKNSTGLSAHQRHCDFEDDEAAESEQEYVSPTSVSIAVADAVFERDEEQCVRCESTDGLTIHRYNPSKDDTATNLVTLCEACDELLGDGHPKTKRGQVGRGL